MFFVFVSLGASFRAVFFLHVLFLHYEICLALVVFGKLVFLIMGFFWLFLRLLAWVGVVCPPLDVRYISDDISSFK